MSVKNNVNNKINNIKHIIGNNVNITNFNEITCNEVISTFRFAKKSKACGIDEMYYESIINVGVIIKNSYRKTVYINV